MTKTRELRIGGASMILALSVVLGCAKPAPAPVDQPAVETTAPADDALAQSFARLVATLQATEASVRTAPAFESDAEQVGGYRHMLRAFAKSLEAEVLQDPDYPYFRILDFWLREGGDNPDQRYAFTPIRGGETYRVWGELGSAKRMELQIYAGRPWDGSGKSAGFMTFEEIEVAADGSFEVWISAEPRDGNWLENPPEATTLFARHIFDEWTDAPTGDIHIDRVGFEGKRRPQETTDELAARIDAMTAMFGATSQTWPAFVQRRYVQSRPANTLSAPIDTYALGGAKGRWMSGGFFDLQPGQALVLRFPETAAKYQAVQLADMWFASLESANQISSLTTKQSVQAPDGAYWYVISADDPGYPNWLDPGALTRGPIMVRWDGLVGQLDAAQYPSAELMAMDEVESAIPGFTRVTEAQREQIRRDRRRHLQLRSHR